METRNFTTTLPVDVLSRLDKASKDLKIAKNDILVKAFSEWNRARMQQLIRESYANAKNDPEMMELANAGMEDWENNIRKWEAR